MGERTLRSEFAVALKPKLEGEKKKKKRGASPRVGWFQRRKKRIGWPYLGKVFTRRIVDRRIGRV